MKRTIEIDDTLDERIESAIKDVKDAFFRYCDENKPDEAPDLGNDLDYDGSIHEIVDGSVPIYTHEIETTWYLHSSRLESAYENAGVGENPRENNGMAAIYYAIDEAVREEYEDNKEDWYEEWKQKALENVEIFQVSAADFLNAGEGDWRHERLEEKVEESGPHDTEEEREECRKDEAESLAGFYWWSCCPGCMPDSDAFGPFDSEDEARENAFEES